ncbi:hypothetical protein PVAND_015904 [Polypedilum vanderplanki]|uniref:Uncharacterized protein n=1 Tax=Polypedilum vanderplanki TaxID=319348 RepID=A0A9J6BEK3_POLVA|nr:hypothetical protein PVAND_015904 [Polypedilum vanderplanki]
MQHIPENGTESVLDKCECLDRCDDIKYNFEVFETKYKRNFDYGEMKLNFYYKYETFLPLVRHQSITFDEFLGQAGGLLGLFAGISFLSIFELIYFWHNGEKFDIIFSSYVIQWIKDYEKVFANIFDALQSNGIFCLITCQLSRIYQIWECLVNWKYKEYASQLGDHFADFCFNYADDKILCRTLKKVGFEIVSFENEKLELDLMTKERFEAKLKTINPFVSSMPEEVLEKFNNDQNTIMKVINNKNKPYSIKYNCLKIIARKI